MSEAMPLTEDIPRNYGEVAYRFVPDETDRVTPHDGLADEYVVTRTPEAISGVIVFAKYHGAWEANISERAVIRRLLATLDAERARREAAERVIETKDACEAIERRRSQAGGAEAANDYLAARAAWLAAKEAPATPTPAPLGDDRGEAVAEGEVKS